MTGSVANFVLVLILSSNLRICKKFRDYAHRFHMRKYLFAVHMTADPLRGGAELR